MRPLIDTGAARDRGPAAEFLLCRNDHHVVGRGSSRTFAAPDEAAAALRDGAVPAVAGAIPFDVRGPAALMAPVRFEVRSGAWQPGPRESAAQPRARVHACEPSPATHHSRVAEAVDALRDPGNRLQKVVLARSLVLTTDEPAHPWTLAATLRSQDPSGSVFVTALPAPGHGGTLVGASPEVLIRKRGRQVSAHPLAGSAPRSTDARVDTARGAELAASGKDRREHAFVVEAVAEALAPLCDRLDVPAEPELTSTPAMWHLGTRIRGELAESCTALDLALRVHPTPAICGTPTATARDHILATEEPRGFYSGAIGWSRAGEHGGDGEWMVAIRCAEFAGDGRSVRTWAGGGIVAESDPDAEVHETRAKMATVLRALHVDPAAG